MKLLFNAAGSLLTTKTYSDPADYAIIHEVKVKTKSIHGTVDGVGFVVMKETSEHTEIILWNEGKGWKRSHGESKTYSNPAVLFVDETKVALDGDAIEMIANLEKGATIEVFANKDLLDAIRIAKKRLLTEYA